MRQGSAEILGNFQKTRVRSAAAREQIFDPTSGYSWLLEIDLFQ